MVALRLYRRFKNSQSFTLQAKSAHHWAHITLGEAGFSDPYLSPFTTPFQPLVVDVIGGLGLETSPCLWELTVGKRVGERHFNSGLTGGLGRELWEAAVYKGLHELREGPCCSRPHYFISFLTHHGCGFIFPLGPLKGGLEPGPEGPGRAQEGQRSASHSASLSTCSLCALMP